MEGRLYTPRCGRCLVPERCGLVSEEHHEERQERTRRGWRGGRIDHAGYVLPVLDRLSDIGSDGILAAFVAGLLFNRFANSSDEADEQKIQETVLRLFTFPIFVLFRIVLPVEQWLALGWSGLALAAGVLLFRRIPMMVVFRTVVSSIHDNRDALFAGWFGPIGVAALFYTTVAHGS